jgi:hypothetical protein
MKIIVFLLVAATLPFLGRFQETKVFQNGQVIFEQSTYGQKLVAGLMIVAAIVLLFAAWKERQRNTDFSRLPRLVRFAPALFALPASGQQWSVSQFGSGGVYTEIKAGLGGPMSNLLLLAAAGLFIAADAYWRQRKNA